VYSNFDLRENKRFKAEAVIWHDNLLPGIFYNAKMYNLSKGGIYFESDQVIYPGEKIYIGIKNTAFSDKKPKDYCRVEIKWRKELQDSFFQYGYGAKFVDASNLLTRKIKWDNLEKKSGRENDLKIEKDPRGHPRKRYRKVLIFTSKNNRYKALISDIGRGGAFILTKHKFNLGQTIQLTIPGYKMDKDVKIKGWIVRRNQNGIGVRFDRRSGLNRRSDLDRRVRWDRREKHRRKDQNQTNRGDQSES
jgi:Tfp pilus assembly protein PilZ